MEPKLIFLIRVPSLDLSFNYGLLVTKNEIHLGLGMGMGMRFEQKKNIMGFEFLNLSTAFE